MNILITGASRGIGAATYELLKSSGHNVVGHSTNGSDELIAGDLMDPAAPRAIWDSRARPARRPHRRAGQQCRHLRRRRRRRSRRGLARRLVAHAARSTSRRRPTSAGSPSQHFHETGGGRIVNVASRAGWRGDSPQHWHYAASKAAIIGMTKTIARAYAAEGILAFAVAPGFTVSEMTEEYLQGRGGAAIVADIPLGRVASTTEVAEVIRWLATEAPASSTGIDHRRQRRQLCSLGSRSSRSGGRGTGAGAALRLPLGKAPRQIEQPRAPDRDRRAGVRRGLQRQ